MDWLAESSRPPGPLETDQLHVWELGLAPPEIEPAEWAELLSVAERDKAARFRFDRDRVRYLTAHAGLRAILASYLGCAPAEVEMEPDALGKPLLGGTGRTMGLSFNLSHSGDRGLIALGRRRHIGVDVELHRDLPDLAEVAESVLSRMELAILQARKERQRTTCFFQMWTRKEAVVKAAGTGIGAAFAGIEIEPADPAEANEFTVVGGLPGMPPLFGANLDLGPDYSAAVACEDSSPRIVRVGPASFKA